MADPKMAKMFKTCLTYLLKEIAAYFEPDDRHVYVTDGGHRENLGLVELLRRQCRTIICIDASGDEPGAFNTLRGAAGVAAVELDVKVEVSDLPDPPPPGQKPPLVEVGHRVLDVTYGNGSKGKIIYLAAQL